ncbi:28s ribosomal protein mitochondrial [Limosa lapponica baueri]|uniref:28s ribosomal protein mitochondrial n=1 Tax=Limosa lapponica baueri TaxID=1758121 RepID=A0A2I0SZN6_LIMLA|nr:28s ribosomal protein mitochondrial [Limosa lapponica baueri]
MHELHSSVKNTEERPNFTQIPGVLTCCGLLWKKGGGREEVCGGSHPGFLPPFPRILTQDGLAEAVRRRRYYEKPCRRRQRLAYEACRRVYNAEMGRKIAFLGRVNRQDPWPGC